MTKNWKNNLLLAINTLQVRPTGRVIRLAFITMLFFLMAGCSRHEESHNDTYTCPMHPTVISDRPGTCPVCGMELVRKARPGEDLTITEDLSMVMKSPNEVVPANVKTIKGEYKSVPVSVKATGVVTYDTRNIYAISSRIGGRLENAVIKYNYQVVQKGQKIAEIYSPELVTAQRELIFLLENDPGNEPLISASKTRLELLGLTQAQIRRLTESRESQYAFAVYSPYTGYVITNDPAPAAPMPSIDEPTEAMDGMGAGVTSRRAAVREVPTGDSRTLPREGSYVSAGEKLFSIVDPSALRIELNLPSAAVGTVRKGDQVTLRSGGETYPANVNFIQPFFNNGENFVKIRVYTREVENLQIGQFVAAEIKAQPKESLWVPGAAVLDLGTKNIVFVKERDVFKPKTIETGIRSEGLIEITKGLASSDELAANAHYLVDSESFIKPVK